MTNHETHCFKNEHRIPYEGEISRPWICFDPDGDGPADDEPEGAPHSGMIYHEGQWLDVPGYKNHEFPVINGTPLDKIPAGSRFDALWPKPDQLLSVAF